MNTGAYTRGDGLSSDEIIIEINGVIENRNKFINGEKVKFIFNNITGLKNENGKSYPGLSLYIVKNDKDTVLQNDDLLANLEDGTELSPLQLQANFTAVLPHDNEESYKALVKIWDKKGDGSLNYELPFTMEANKLLKIKKEKLTFTEIYLWDKTENHVVVNNEINIANEFIFALEGIDGLEIVDGKAFPSLSIEIIDNNGKFQCFRDV
ncbi:hypothetical protein OO013_16395 [Mangrovivirga sp. M17]|uniref:Uncharacterized protein n=1 Tax=Mangrovivirga halotolerans TaxID=2993936 RepID=A0ABT3RVA4_9BACT|nr:hypothetical protein [Mangrovivirga halotolerans]MCX2745461.1 hypothetical protein [Mangrovivirga halotolerans]